MNDDNLIMKEAAGALIRKLVTGIGAILISRGFLDAGTLDESAISWICGAVMLAGSWVLSKLSREKIKTVAATVATIETKTAAIQAVRDTAGTMEGKAVLANAIDTAILKKTEEKKETK